MTNDFNYSQVFRLHSETTLSFLNNLKIWTKEIITKELGLSMPRSRILYKGRTVPLEIVVFEHPTRLGYFQEDIYQLGINKYLMSEAHIPVIKNILRHELMHFITFLDFKDEVFYEAHGKEFQQSCKRFGFDKVEIMRAKASISKENELIESHLNQEKLIERIKKLLSLAHSENPFEAELATQKANELLLKHNLEIGAKNSPDSIDLYIKSIYEAPKLCAKMKAIRSIIETFLVYPVFNCGRGKTYLEVTGTKTNVLLADYIASFLDLELERLWKLHKKQNNKLSGLKDKNSFFIGIARGYCEKTSEGRKHNYSKEEQKALLCLQDQLEIKVSQIYSHLRGLHGTGASLSKQGLNQGFLAGKQDLQIKKPLENSSSSSRSKNSKNSGLFLPL